MRDVVGLNPSQFQLKRLSWDLCCVVLHYGYSVLCCILLCCSTLCCVIILSVVLLCVFLLCCVVL